MRTYEINGYYGSQKTKCNVLVAQNSDGSSWYCVDGSCNVNLTFDAIRTGVNVEELKDVDMFTASEINSLDELVTAIES